MTCKNCGNEFSGNFCPMCGTKAEKETQKPEDRNPYAEDYVEFEEQKAYTGQPMYSQPERPVYQQPYNAQYQHPYQYQQPVQQPYPYQQPYYYPYPPQQQKSMGAGKVVGIVAIVIAGLLVLTILPELLFISCLEMAASPNTKTDSVVHVVGDTVEDDYFTYELTSATYSDKYEGKEAKEGYEFLTIEFEIENVSDEIESYDLEFICDADDYYCRDESNDYYSLRLLPGKKSGINLVYSVPKDANTITLTMTSDDYDDENVYTFYIK